MACACFDPMDIPAHGHSVSMNDTRNFRHWDILAEEIFGAMDVSARDILAPEHFGTWIFWHLAKQYGHFGIDILATVLVCCNGHFNTMTFWH